MKKKYLVGGLLMAAAAASQAQTAGTGVTIYGIYDTGIEYVSNVKTATGTGSAWRMPNNTGEFASRIGFRGTEDLGGGLNAIYTIESGFTPDAGTSGQGGRLFGRQAFVGLSGSSWGQITFGRQWTMMFWGLLDSDILGSNAFGSGSLDSYFPNAREDNAISYRGKFGGLSLGATYSFGRDTVAGGTPPANNCAGEVANNYSACKAFSAMVKYDTDSWGLSAIIDRMNGAPTGTTGVYGNLVGPSKHDTRASLSGWAKFNALKLGAGVISRHNDGTPTTVSLTGQPAGLHSNLYFLEAAYAVSPALVVDGGWFHQSFKDYSGGNSNLFALRATYGLSKRTFLYGTVGYINNGDNVAVSVDGAQSGATPPAGGNQTGVMVGIRHNF